MSASALEVEDQAAKRKEILLQPLVSYTCANITHISTYISLLVTFNFFSRMFICGCFDFPHDLLFLSDESKGQNKTYIIQTVPDTLKELQYVLHNKSGNKI